MYKLPKSAPFKKKKKQNKKTNTNEWLLVVTGDSLTRRPKRLFAVSWSRYLDE